MSLPVASQDSTTLPIERETTAANVAPRLHSPLWVIGGRCAGILGTALVAFLLPRCLTPADCGQFLLIQNLIGLAGLLAAGGLPLAIVKLLGEGLAFRDARRTTSALSKTLWILLGTSAVIAAAAAGMLVVLGPSLLKIELHQAWLSLFCVTVMLLAWQWVMVEAIRGLGELRWASLFAGGQSGGPISTLLFVAGLTIISARSTNSATVALALYAAAFAVTLPVIIWCLRLTWHETVLPLESSEKQPHDSSLSLRDVFAVSLPICATQLLAYLTLSADLPIAGFFSDAQEVALLGQTRRLMLVLQLPAQMVVMTILPAVARLYAEGNLPALEKLVRKSTTYSALFTLAAASVLLIAPGPILALLFGEYYRQGAPLLVALSISQLIAAHNGMAGYVLLMAGRQRSVAAINALTALLMVTVGPACAYFGGILGLTIASATILALQSMLEWWMARRLLKVSSQFDWRVAMGLLVPARRPTE